VSLLALGALGAVVAFGVLPMVVGTRLATRGAPRLGAAFHLVVLLGWAVLPIAVLACLGQDLSTLAAALVGTKMATGALACPPGPLSTPWQLVGLGLGAVGVVPLVREGWRTLRALRRLDQDLAACPPGSLRRFATRSGTEVLVVQNGTNLAMAGGLRRPRALVSTGLLEGLGEGEQRAVLEHEAAHIRLGHARLLVIGAVVAGAWGTIPPVRLAWSQLKAELEAAADDEAAAVVGKATVRTALARVGLAVLAKPAAGFGDPEHLRWRIRRLEEGSAPPPVPLRASLLVGLAGLVAALAWSSCALFASTAAPDGLAGCALAVLAVAMRPLWSHQRRRRAAGVV
jgi:hypothetical protein